MGLQAYSEKPIGCFVEKDTGNCFEYSVNEEPVDFARGHQAAVDFAHNYPHKIWVGGKGVAGQSGWRYANVKKTVAYIIIDEDDGGPIVERWFLKSNVRYFIRG